MGSLKKLTIALLALCALPAADAWADRGRDERDSRAAEIRRLRDPDRARAARDEVRSRRHDRDGRDHRRHDRDRDRDRDRRDDRDTRDERRRPDRDDRAPDRDDVRPTSDPRPARGGR